MKNAPFFELALNKKGFEKYCTLDDLLKQTGHKLFCLNYSETDNRDRVLLVFINPDISANSTNDEDE